MEKADVGTDAADALRKANEATRRPLLGHGAPPAPQKTYSV